MNKKNIAIATGALFLIVITASITYWFSATSKIEKESVVKEDVKRPEPIAPAQILQENLFVPEGWVSYTDPDFKVAFSYPKQWEMFRNKRSVVVKGDGYSMGFSNTGGDLEQKDWTHPRYYIGGYEVPGSWEFFDGEKYQQIFSLAMSHGLPNVIIKIFTPGNSKVLSDRVVSSIRFLK